VLSNPEIAYQVARARLDERLAEAARAQQANEARRAAPGFIPPSRMRDTAFWASVAGPLVGVGFVAYFAQVLSLG
jgi:hypothetical protein